MTKQTPIVGVLSPGDMGRSIGMVLQGHGIRTLTCLAGRSERTRALAADAGFEDTASLEELVHRADILLCVLVPDRAAGVADESRPRSAPPVPTCSTPTATPCPRRPYGLSHRPWKMPERGSSTSGSSVRRRW